MLSEEQVINNIREITSRGMYAMVLIIPVSHELMTNFDMTDDEVVDLVRQATEQKLAEVLTGG